MILKGTSTVTTIFNGNWTEWSTIQGVIGECSGETATKRTHFGVPD